jgi:signal transduction histidine kinase
MIILLHDRADRDSISIRTELDSGLPLITADRVQLQQVLMNLILNGIEAMKDAKGEPSVTSKRTDDGQLLASVSDSGIGIPSGEVDRIFEAFFTTKTQGTGMGLSISRRIIESPEVLCGRLERRKAHAKFCDGGLTFCSHTF